MALGEILVGGTVAVTVTALVAYRLLGKRGKEVPVSGAPPEVAAAPIMINVKSIMMILVSILVLGSSLYIILSGNYDSENQKWAFGAVGSIMGFWLRPEQA
jgi:hypothetical protein